MDPNERDGLGVYFAAVGAVVGAGGVSAQGRGARFSALSAGDWKRCEWKGEEGGERGLGGLVWGNRYESNLHITISQITITFA